MARGRGTRRAAGERHVARAIGADGASRPIDAEAIVVDLAAGSIVIDLTPGPPAVEGRVRLHTDDASLLVVGPGDGSSIYVALERRKRRSKR